MKKFNIPLRTLKEARELAYDRHKISYTIMDENGKEKLITQGVLKLMRIFSQFGQKKWPMYWGYYILMEIYIMIQSEDCIELY